MAVAFLVGAAALNLVCLGAGSANRPNVTTGYAYDNRGNSAWGQVVAQRSVPFDDQVMIEIEGDGTGRILMPRAMLPPIRGGDNGWFKLKKIKTTANEITGSVAVNFINSPKLRLDRIRGTISISGKAGDYFGECQPFDPATVQRRF